MNNIATSGFAVMPDRDRRVIEFFEAPGFFSERDLDVITSTSRTTRWRMRRAGTFPEAVQISPGRRGTPKRLIIGWIEQREGKGLGSK